MKKLFTKIYYFASVILLFLGASLPASGQVYTSTKLVTNAWAGAVCTDASGNIYAVESANKNFTSDFGKVVKYPVGSTSPATIYTGTNSTLPFTDCDADGTIPSGIAVTSNGDVYITINFDVFATNCSPFWGGIIKLTYTPGSGNPGTYTESTFLAGTSSFGAFTSLAVDANDNLYALAYDATGNNGTMTTAGIPGCYEVEEFPAPAPGGAPVAASKFRINNSDACQLYLNALNTDLSPNNETGLTVDPTTGNIYVADAFDGGQTTITGTVYKLAKGSGNNYTKSTFRSLNVMALGADAAGNIYAVSNTGGPSETLTQYVGGSTSTTHSIATGLAYGPEFQPNTIAAVSSGDVYINDGDNSGQSDEDGIEQFTTPPTSQASGVNFTGTTEKTTTINWTNGGGMNRAVFVALSTAGSISLTTGTTYTAFTTFGSGTPQAGTGWFCVYNGSGATNSVSISNLTANTGYKVMVAEYNGSASDQNYDTGAGATNNPTTFTTLAAPSLTASGGTDSYNIGGTAATVDAGITVTAGQTNLSTATINVSTGFSTGDVLNFTNQNGITGSFTSATGVLTLSGSSSVANYQTALQSITFSSSSASTTQRTISFLVGDGTSNSNTVTKNITVSASTSLSSIALVNAATNNLSSVQYTVMFGASVSGLGTANFTATASGGISGASVTAVSASNPYTVTVNTGSGSGTLRLDLTSNSGLSPAVSNEPYTSGPSYTIDRTAPAVSSVGVPANGSYGASQVLNFTVNFSKNITVTGTPQIALIIGSSTVHASYVSGSGTAALTFGYTVAPGDNDADGITVGGAINLNGGTITDALGNAATLTLNSVGSTTNVLVDTTPPSVSSITATTPSNTNPTNATSVTYTVTFSEGVTGVDNNDFTFTSGGASPGGVNVISVSSSVYTVTVSGISGNGTLRLDLKGSGTGIADLAGNAISGGFTGGDTYTFDHTAPTASSITATGASPTNATSVGYTVTFSEGVTGVDNTDFTATVSGVTTTGITVTPVSSSTYTVTVNGVSGNGTVRLDLNSSSTGIADLAGNAISGGFTGGDTYTIDQAAPTVSSIAATGASPTNATSVGYTVTFSEGVTGVDNTDFTATVSGVSTTGITVTPVSSSTYTVTVNGVSGNGTVRLDLNSSSTGIADLVGNAISGGFTGGDTYNIDQAAPTVSSIAATGTSPTNATSVGYTVTFSEGVTGVDNTDFTATVSGVSTTGITVTPVSSSVYTVTVNGVSGNGTLRLDLNSSGTGIDDLVGNAISGGFTGGDTYTIDQTAPIVSSITATGASPTNATIVAYTVTFSEAVTGVDNTDFTATVSGVTTTGITVTPVSSSVYTVTVNGVSGNGTVRLDLNSSGTGIADLVGNAISGGFTGGDTYTIDQTAPTVVSIAATDPVQTNETSLDYQITFNEPVTGVDASDFTATTSGVGAGTISVSPVSATIYNITINTVSGNGTLRLDLNSSGTGIADLAGNAISGGFTSGDTYNVDQTPPAATISAPSVTQVGNSGSGSVTYTVTYADANFNTSNLTGAGITLNTTGTATGTVAVSGSGTSYTVTISGITGLGTIGISVGAGFANDLAGNTDLGAGPSATFTVLSSNAFLSHIAISSGSLTPAAGVNNYTANVSYDTQSVTVTPTTSDPNATVTVALNGGTPAAVTPGTPSGSLPLNIGANTISTVVTAQDGVTTQTYTITVTRAGSYNAGLTHIAISSGSLTPAAGVNNYTANVSYDVQSVTVTPTTSDPNATVTVAINGGTPAAVSPGTPSGSLSLNIGANTISIKVTAQNGVTTQTYTITVTRAGSYNAGLTHIAISSGSLTPAAGVNNYTANVSYDIQSVTVTPTTSDPNATVTVAINGGTPAAVSPGTPSGSLSLNIGANTISIKVTAQNGIATQTYTITVTRAGSYNAGLTHIAISSGTLVPAGTNNYTANVSYDTRTVTVTPTTSDPNATVTVAINGGTPAAVTPGTPSGSLSLNIGANTISIKVTAQNGIATQTYTITVTRAGSYNAGLTHIAISSGTLVPAGTNNYTANVSYDTRTVTVTPTTSDPNATVTVAINGGTPAAVTPGTPSGSLSLNIGANTISIKVTAQNGIATQTYTITVTRAGSYNAGLTHIAISSGSLTPAAGVNNYTANVSYDVQSVTVTSTTSDPNATVTVAINGGTPAAVSPGTPSGSLSLNIGANTISIKVTAQNGIATQTYTITVTRAGSYNAGLTHIAISSGTLVPAGTNNYTANVSYDTRTVTVTPTTSDPNATVTVAINGGTPAAVTPGTPSGSLSLNIGANTISIKVTAQNGIATQTYTITVTRATGPLMSLYQPMQPEISVVKPTDNATIENDGVMVHQGVSPNGDGINDVLTIDGINQYPDNQLSIIDRNGALLYQAQGYDNSSKAFDGHSSINGKLLQSGTYFYSLDYSVNGQNKHKTGFILLKY